MLLFLRKCSCFGLLFSWLIMCCVVIGGCFMVILSWICCSSVLL